MTDITESDIDSIIQIASEYLFLLGQSITIEKRRELANIIDKFKLQKTPILQHQKLVDAIQKLTDEYAWELPNSFYDSIKDLLKESEKE